MAQSLDRLAGRVVVTDSSRLGTSVGTSTSWAPPVRKDRPQLSAGRRRPAGPAGRASSDRSAAAPRGAKRLADLSGGIGKGYPYP